jgi:DNA-binding response OmpR family regulator
MKKKILITDDDLGVQDAFKIIFERAGYEVSVSADAQCLLDETCEYPDVIVLDWHLSGIDGLDVCRFLKSKESTRSIPVIMVSATPGINLKAKEAGANDFVEKPFIVKELLAVINRWVNADRGTLS